MFSICHSEIDDSKENESNYLGIDILKMEYEDLED